MRNTSDQLQALQAFLDTLPDDVKSKCTLCNKTLVHIVKQAEVASGVGTATVARALAEQINETALPDDQVTGDQLRDRVRRNAGEKESGRTAQIKKMTMARKVKALKYADMAIDTLEKIADDDPDRHEAFNLVRKWMDAEENPCCGEGL